MRNKKLKYNTISSFFYQIVAIVCGFILPKLIIDTYGSETNGLVSSINEFLAVITLMEMGIGTVVQSALYDPLAREDNTEISKIVSSASKFFKKIALLFLGYIIFLLVIYPNIVNANYDYLFSGILIIAIAINYFVQYYFGIVDRLLLIADQRGYIYYLLNAVTLLANTIISVVLIYAGIQIHFVKLMAALIYIVRPMLIRSYVNKRYTINRNIKYTGEPISQKWNGFTQHFASFVLDGTDTIILSVFSSLENVSIYTVYYLVIKGVKELFMSLMNGIQSVFGELWAKKQLNDLKILFKKTEWVVHTSAVFLFGCTACLIVKFVGVYTASASDANYYQPLFAYVLTFANGFRCLRLPYNMMIFAAGHFKESQQNFIVAVILNITISIVMVVKFGLVGVAIGTMVALVYQTIWMSWYASKTLLKRSYAIVAKQMIVDVTGVLLAMGLCFLVNHTTGQPSSYFQWAIVALKTSVVWFISLFTVNIIMYKRQTMELLSLIQRKFLRR